VVIPLVLLPLVDDAPVHQVIVVRAQTWSSQRATLRRFERVQDQWVAVGPRVDAWIGVNGFAPRRERRQNSGETPAGIYRLPMAFGRSSENVAKLPFHRVTPSSYWPYDPRDPRTYNVLQTNRSPRARWRDDGQWSERLASYGRAYRLAVVIGYNLPGAVYRHPATGEWRTRKPAATNKGGGIFLHVHRSRPTAGCVAIGLRSMRATARWLDQDANPRIVMGTYASTRGWRAKVP